MQSRLNKLRERIQNKNARVGFSTSIYYLAKELCCLPELLGREYDVIDVYGKKVFTIKQKPITIPAFMILLQEMQDDWERQERAMKSKRGSIKNAK